MLTLINAIARAEPFDDPDCLYEPKFDGFCAAADTIVARLTSRNGNRMQRGPDFLPSSHVFDADLVVLD